MLISWRYLVQLLVVLVTLLYFVSCDGVIVKHPIVQCTSTKGKFDIEIYRDWSPLGSQRFLELVVDGFFSDIALYRSVNSFLAQFGISDKVQYKHWHNANIRDDPNLYKGIKKHYVSYAGGGPDTRSTELFIAYEDLDFLGSEPWETPFGQVVWGHEVVDSWYTGYGDMKGMNDLAGEDGVDQEMIYSQGNRYLKSNFPLLDYILSCELYIETERGPQSIHSLYELSTHTQLTEHASIQLQLVKHKQAADATGEQKHNIPIATHTDVDKDSNKNIDADIKKETTTMNNKNDLSTTNTQNINRHTATTIATNNSATTSSPPNTVGSDMTLLMTFLLMIVFVIYSFVWSVLGDNWSKVDQIWSITPVIYAWCFVLSQRYSYSYSAAASSSNNNHNVLQSCAVWLNSIYASSCSTCSHDTGVSSNSRLIAVSLLITLWGVRLTYNFWRKDGYGNLITHEEDYRWAIVRTELVPEKYHHIFNLTFVAFYQNLLLWLVCAPVYAVYVSNHLSFDWSDAVLVLVFVMLLAVETIADEQQWQFQSFKHKLSLEERSNHPSQSVRDGFLQTGLFKHSRHPNYFAEQSMWCIVYCFSIRSHSLVNWSVVGALLYIALFAVSMQFSEGITRKKYHMYKVYQAKVSQCVPFTAMKRFIYHFVGNKMSHNKSSSSSLLLNKNK